MFIVCQLMNIFTVITQWQLKQPCLNACVSFLKPIEFSQIPENFLDMIYIMAVLTEKLLNQHPIIQHRPASVLRR